MRIREIEIKQSSRPSGAWGAGLASCPFESEAGARDERILGGYLYGELGLPLAEIARKVGVSGPLG
jgi:hypothetical protein